MGLPTALALFGAGADVVGVDTSPQRLDAVARGAVDLLPVHHAQLACALESDSCRFTSDLSAIGTADAVIVCVPTPVDAHRRPDLGPLSGACAAVVSHAVPGQLLVLTSTSHVGTTRELLVEPLAARGLHVEDDVLVAFSPERIDPGNEHCTPEHTPRLVGGAGARSARAAAELLAPTASRIHVVDRPETAEMAKLWENTYRAVNIALANELADASLALGLEPQRVIEAAATKPYGFMPFYPGPGVGGHCIPCDPHYLLSQLRAARQEAPLVTAAMAANAERPALTSERALARWPRMPCRFPVRGSSWWGWPTRRAWRTCGRAPRWRSCRGCGTPERPSPTTTPWCRPSCSEDRSCGTRTLPTRGAGTW